MFPRAADDLSVDTYLDPAAASMADIEVRLLLRCCAAMGVPREWVNDTASHFKNVPFGWWLRRWIKGIISTIFGSGRIAV